jgi:hypothetical protein
MSLLPDWMTGYDASNAEAAAAADAQLRQINKERYDGTSLAGIVKANYAKQEKMGTEAQRAEIDKSFTDELKARANSIFGTPLRWLGEILKATFLAVPVWIWLVAAIAVFFYFGGGGWLKRKLKK